MWLEEIDLRSAPAVCRVLREGAGANKLAGCRQGSIDTVRAGPDDLLIATGDLHDNPLHLARLLALAGMDDPAAAPGAEARAHLTLHEIIHGGRLVNDMDFSYRALVRVAAVKAAFPERAHVLLANHELSLLVGAGIIKDGVNVGAAFSDAIEFVFGESAPEVSAAVGEFIRSMPLALRWGPVSSGLDVLCAHSVPSPELMDRFDAAVLGRELTEEDYAPRRGAAHLMVWGRGHEPQQLADLAARWGVGLFVLGHEHAPDGAVEVAPNAVVLNSDHEKGAYLPIRGGRPPDARAAVLAARRLALQ